MARLRMEVHIGNVKHAFVRDGVAPELFGADRTDDLRKELLEMADVLSEWWEMKASTPVSPDRTTGMKAQYQNLALADWAVLPADAFDPNG